MDEKKVTDMEFLDETEKLKEELRQKLANLEEESAESVEPAESVVVAESETSEAQEPVEEPETVEEPEVVVETQTVTESEMADDEYKQGYVDDNDDSDDNDDNDDDFEEIVIESEEDTNKKQLTKKIFNIVYDVLIVVGIALLLYGGYSFYDSYRDSKEAEESYKNLENEFVVQNPVNSESTENSESESTTEGTEEVRPKEWYEMIWVDLEGLQTQVNPDIVGWIFFENEDLSYPILYSEDNAEYDRVRYDLVYSKGGSITLEANNTPDFSDMRNVIYGHNMRDGSMFGKLKQYNQDKTYYDDHQYFQLLYDGMVYRYQIFSYFLIHESDVEYINVDFNSADTYEEFIQNLVKKSIKKTDVEVTGEDKTVTLLTCAPDNTYRFLVNAVLVDQHAMANADGTYPDDEPDTEVGTDGETETGTEDPGTETPTESEDEQDTQEPEQPEYTYTEVGKTMWATTAVKVRNKPSTDGVRIGYLAEDMMVYVDAVCNETGWYRVYYDRVTGYVNGVYLTEVPPETETTEPEVPSEPEVPGTEEPETTLPGTENAGTENPGTEIPGTEEPTESEVPGTEEPSTSEPSTEEPTESEVIGTETPSTETPGTEEPTEPEETESQVPTESESTTEPGTQNEPIE